MRGRRTLREVMQDHQRSEDTLAAIWGKPRRELPIPPEPQKRAPATVSYTHLTLPTKA